jgi:MerR family transcriptional regulator, copper efflux regulator
MRPRHTRPASPAPRSSIMSAVDAPVGIGVAARIAGVSVRMARHYEAVGLLTPTLRSRTGDRRFLAADIHTLGFIGRARALGFPLETVRTLLSLWHDPHRSNADIVALAEPHRAELERKRLALQAMSTALQLLIEACAGDGRSECPILEELADMVPADGARVRELLT